MAHLKLNGKKPEADTTGKITNLTKEEKELWLHKRNFLVKKLGFPRGEAAEGASRVIRAFREEVSA